MKTLITTLFLFLLTLTLVVGNALYINKVANRMTEQLEQLPSPTSADCRGQVSALRADWEQKIPHLCLSVRYTVLDAVTERIAVLESCAEQKNQYEFYNTLALLKDALADLVRPEQPSTLSWL
ncbi:MAG: DUF4363 family protein [Clostridia bacterium]|nr:DUF4363 family protein [Clostridia bacterium]